jgi:ABC-type transport system involved in multi-copper enzyme maturation permease subunit
MSTDPTTAERAAPASARRRVAVSDTTADRPVPFAQLLGAELFRIRRSRTTYGLLGAALLIAVLAVISPLADPQGINLGSDDGIRQVLGSAGAGAIFALALGVLGTAGEVRHGTATTVFLAVPARLRVLASKAVAHGITGLAFGAACCVLAVAVALPWLSSLGHPAGLLDREVVLVLLGTLATTALYGTLGAALGTLVPNQAGALLIALGWFLVAETAIVELLPDVGKWLPGGAASALNRAPDDELLAQGWGALVFVAWVAVFLAAAAAVLRERDVAT